MPSKRKVKAMKKATTCKTCGQALPERLPMIDTRMTCLGSLTAWPENAIPDYWKGLKE